MAKPKEYVLHIFSFNKTKSSARNASFSLNIPPGFRRVTIFYTVEEGTLFYVKASTDAFPPGVIFILH